MSAFRGKADIRKCGGATLSDTRLAVARSTDFGHTFSPAVLVNAQPLAFDSGPDARPAIAVDRQGRIAIAFDIFKDKEFNGQVFYTHSEDGGQTFARPVPITADAESQRFQIVAFDPDGSLTPVWPRLDVTSAQSQAKTAATQHMRSIGLFCSSTVLVRSFALRVQHSQWNAGVMLPMKACAVPA